MKRNDFIQQVYENSPSFEQSGVLNSIIIAMACLESGYGSSNLMKNANAYFGIKATKTWLDKGNKIYNSKTKECYDGKTFVTITDSFRAYDSLKESINDFISLMKTTRYKKVIGETDFLKAITLIKNSGYATDTDYIHKVYSVYMSNKLSRFDNVSRETLYKKGDKVEVIKAVDHKGTKLKLYFPNYDILQVNTDNTVVLSKNGQVFARLPITNIRKVG